MRDYVERLERTHAALAEIAIISAKAKVGGSPDELADSVRLIYNVAHDALGWEREIFIPYEKEG